MRIQAPSQEPPSSPALGLQWSPASALPGPSPELLPVGVPSRRGDRGPGALQPGRRSLSGNRKPVSGQWLHPGGGGGQMAPWPLLFPVGSPCGSSCQSSSPSELLKLELEPGLGLGLGPAKQAKRKGLPGKIPFREFSRQWSGDSFVAAPWQMTTEHSVHQPDDRPEDRLP